MGSTFSNTVDFLRDPSLVRKFQEMCGVQQVVLDEDLPIIPESETDTEIDDATSSDSKDTNSKEIQHKRGHSRESSGEYQTKMRGHSRESSGEYQTKMPHKRGHSRESSGEYQTKHRRSHSRESSGEYTKMLLNGNILKRRHRIKTTPTPSPSHSRTSSLDSEIDPTILEPVKTEITVESYPMLDVYFRLATECGYEPFYITVIPFLFWNIDGMIARHATLLWCMSMYVGQACKQLFQWKRPATPPALRLEDNPNLETEYGFPSTHAIVSTVLPFYLLYGTYGRYEYPFWFGFLLTCIWSTSVCFSRIYLGVHSLMDIVGGIIISTIILLLTVPNIGTIDNFLIHSPYTAYFALIAVIFLLYIYPVDPNKWTMDRGDTAAILGASIGAVLGAWYHGGYPDDLATEVFIITIPSIQTISLSIVRFIVGVLIILPTRFVMKLLCFKLLPHLMPTHGVKEVVHRPLVELPYKIITYGAIGFNASYLAPVVFAICGISRW